MSTAGERAAMIPITRRVRAYFAPVDRTTNTATVFDPARHGAFLLDAPPAPWIDLGWIDQFTRSCTTRIETMQAGAMGAAGGQFRAALGAQVEFNFREWGKLQMALACGSQHMNVLESDPNADLQPSGGRPIPAVAVLPGSSASEVVLGAGAVDAFMTGDLVAVDTDYAQQVGYVGSGIPAAYVSDASKVSHDMNYTRRVTFNVGRVSEKTATSLLLTQPLLGGIPTGSAGAQKVVAFVDREGGSFFQQWSALFIMEEESGGRICLHYPRLSATATGASRDGSERERPVEISGTLGAMALHAAFVALPEIDENDGETVLCYRSYFPATLSALY